MQASLRRAAELFMQAGIPQDRARPLVRACDMTNKVTFYFADPTKATDFLNMINTPTIDFADPIYPTKTITFRVKRDLELDTRLLFLAMCKVRGMMATVMRDLGKEMGSNGLGGDIYVLRPP